MNTEMKTASQARRQMALIAGSSLILMALLAGVGYGYAFETLYVEGDTLATFQQFNQTPSLVYWVVATFVGILLLDVVVGWALYGFFYSTNSHLSMLAAVLRWVYSFSLGTALLPLLPLLDSAKMQKAAEVMAHLEDFLRVWSLGLILFGVHLLVLGYLILKSPKIPKWLGSMVCFAGICYVGIHAAQQIIADFSVYRKQIETMLSAPMALGELSLAIWLLVRGGKG